jgi:hypothetical protein
VLWIDHQPREARSSKCLPLSQEKKKQDQRLPLTMTAISCLLFGGKMEL